MGERIEHVGHGEGMSMFIGRVSGCPACEAAVRFPEAVRRAEVTDAEFWERVLGAGTHHEPDDYDPSHEAVDSDVAASPCPECGASGACDWDSEGRPLIHASTGEDGGK
jgi:hypothetical protein